METLYNIAFWTGLILPAVSLLFSAVLNLFDFSLDIFNLGGDISLDGGVLPQSTSKRFLVSPTAILIFLLLFGGVGKLLYDHAVYIHLTASLLSGVLGGYIVEFGIMRKLKRVRAETVKSENFIGKWGIITQAIGENGYGAITFKTKVGRSTFIAVAKEPIKLGEEAEVVRCENGRMFVKPAHPFPIENIHKREE